MCVPLLPTLLSQVKHKSNYFAVSIEVETIFTPFKYSVTNISPLWTIFLNIFYLLFGFILNQLWQILLIIAIGVIIFIVMNGQMMRN